MDFKILILGTDINAYTMARCAHEIYGKKVDLIGKIKVAFTDPSDICNVLYETNIYDNVEFKKILKEYGEKNLGNKILLVGTNDTYIKLISEHKKFLSKWYVFNYPSLEITNSFLDKSVFYKEYSDILDIPKSFIHDCSVDEMNFDKLTFPVVLKPCDGDLYHSLSFEGQCKVFKVSSKDELENIIKLIKNAGYNKDVLIQEFVDGDDSRLTDCMFYINSKGKAENATFAQIALQEHTKSGVGNCTVLINGYNEFGIDEKLVNRLKCFLEDLNYTGFAEVDLKYDNKNNIFKVFEINPRQARCSYYFSVCSKNLIKCLVDDLIYNKETEFVLSKEKKVLSFVPKKVIYENINSKKLLYEIKKEIKNGNIINSLDYKKDKNIKRKVYLLIRKINYIKKYSNKNWW